MVRIILKYVHEGYGAQRIATYLNNSGYRARTGKMWHHASIRGIICNLTYTGVLRSGESRSQCSCICRLSRRSCLRPLSMIRTARANSAEKSAVSP